MTQRRPHAEVIAGMSFLTERQRSELTWLVDGDLRDAAKEVAEWGPGHLDTLVSIGASVVHGMPRHGPPVYGFVRDHYRAVFAAEAGAATELARLRRELAEAKEEIASLRIELVPCGCGYGGEHDPGNRQCERTRAAGGK